MNSSGILPTPLICPDMARTKPHNATAEACAWLRHTAGLLLATNQVPPRFSRPLFIPDEQLTSRWLLLRTVMVLDLWRRYYKPLTDAQAIAYQLGSHVERDISQQVNEWQYMGHLCATASATKLREVYQEICMSGQVLLPKEFQSDDLAGITPAKVEAVARKSRGANSQFLQREPFL